jgi:putative ABC transport system ATP-binding protein
MTPVLELVDVTRRFETRAETIVAVDSVSLTVEAGEVAGLAGPSGSGKSTLLHVVMGWERPDAGQVRRATTTMRAGWSNVAIVPQELGLLPELTARQNVELAGRIARSPMRDTSELLDALRLTDLADRLPEQLSMGEQQRVAVARAAVAAPALLVADEPTAHQDEAHADLVMALLDEVAAAGGAVLVATHDERLLDRVDRVIRMRDGRLLGD